MKVSQAFPLEIDVGERGETVEFTVGGSERLHAENVARRIGKSGTWDDMRCAEDDLVGGLGHFLIFSIYNIGNVILPTDNIFQKG